MSNQNINDGEESGFLRIPSSTSSDFRRRPSSSSCYPSSVACDFLTELELQVAAQAEAAEASDQASLQSTNPSFLLSRQGDAETNPGFWGIEPGAHQGCQEKTQQRPAKQHVGHADFAFLHPKARDSAEASFNSNLDTEQVIFNRAPIEQSIQLKSLLAHVLIFTQRPYDFLERKVEHYKRKLVKQTLSVVFHSSAPLDILLRRPFVAVAFLLLAALHIFLTIDAFLSSHTRVEGLAFRFTPLELNNGASDIHHPHVAAFSVLTKANHLGCLHDAAPSDSYSEGKHLIKVFAASTSIDGFSVTTTQSEPSQDPSRFEVSVQREDGYWHVVGGHRSYRTFTGARRLGPAIRLPQIRGATSTFDLRASQHWPWVVGRVGGGLFVGVGLAVAGLAGMVDRVGKIGRPALYGCWAAGALAMGTASLWSGVRGEGREALMWGVYGAVYACGTLAVWWRERGLTATLLGLGAAVVAADLLCHGLLVGRSAADATVSVSHGVLGSAMVVAALLLGLLSLSQHRAVARVLAADKAAYSEVWRELCSRPETAEELGRLEEVVAHAELRCSGVATQCQKIVVRNGRGTGVDGSREGSVGLQWVWWFRNAWSTLMFDTPHESVRMEPLRSLDQIYAQATCCYPILRRKVQEWAGRTGGMVATVDGGWVRWEEARGSEEVRRRVKWGQMKQEGRAVEKVIRCYGEEVARLVDVCRQSLVFATLGELAHCLQAMADDQDVQLVRVKNRLRPEEDGAASAGFRNVSVNLRLVEEEARSFGVDSHVCELQLLLRDFAHLQGVEGRHERYLLHRDYARPQPQLPSVAAWLLDVMGRSWGEGGDDQGHVLRFRLPQAASASTANGESSRATRSFERLSSADSAQSGASRRSTSMHEALGSPFLEFSPRATIGSNRMFRRFSQERLACHALRGDNRRSGWASTVREDVLLAFRQLVFQRNTSSRGLLDFWEAMETVSAFSVFFIQHPVQGALTKRLWRCFFLFIAISGIGMTMSYLYFHFAVWHTFPLFRFVAVGHRGNQSVAPLTHGLSGFGVARAQCPALEHVLEIEEDGPTLMVHYARPVAMNSFWLRTSNQPNSTDFDPIRFWVEGSHDGETWTRVGASSMIDSIFGGYVLSDLPYPTPLARNAQIVVGASERVRTANLISWETVNFTFVACGVTAVRAMFGNLNNVGVLAGGMLATFLGFLLSGVWNLVGAKELEDIDPGLQHTLHNLGSQWTAFSFTFFIMGGTVLCRQRSLAFAAAIALAYGLSVQLVFEYETQKKKGMPSGPIVWTIFAILVAILTAHMVRAHILWYSRRVVAGDKKHYDELWKEISQTQTEDLTKLAELSSQLCPDSDAPRQCYSHAIIAGVNAQLDRGLMRMKPVPIMDINQIYAQATLAHPILIAKVQEWAGRTGGMVATVDGGWVRWEEARGSEEVRRRVKWGQMKQEGRAVEKVIRCYGEEVARLVDVCRQSLVFATLGELAHCLQAMADDQDVQLVRVKNRLRPEEDGAASAGFRNVSVNLRLVEEEARSFGVDSHVCELQLLLRDFAHLQVLLPA